MGAGAGAGAGAGGVHIVPVTDILYHIAASKVSQTTVGIIAAIFCAVVFVGVGMLRCIMIGACNVCNAPNPPQERQVMGNNDSYTFRADFPPSYSTG